ncbi:MAG: GDP-L-fucose synthase [Armatimonadota bacterium]|nr:GDP-L-fucose synthase [bacterium]
MNKDSLIYVAGHRGLVGSSITRRLNSAGYTNLVLRTSSELDLRDQYATRKFFEDIKPEYVFLAAAKVGGILANNTYPSDFIRDNLLIQTNIIDSAYCNGAKKLLFLGSSCIYPKLAPQPITEDCLMTGPLEPTNDAYAIAKIAGIKMCQSYTKQYGFNTISLMPTNLYGPEDNFHPENSHVLPALIRRFHEAKITNAPEITIWGTGKPMREFLHVDDMADAAAFLMNNYDSPDIVNVGTGDDLSIRELAEIIADVVGFKGELRFDSSKPDGTPRKLLDISRILSLGWKPSIGLVDGIKATYQWYIDQYATS